MEIDYSILYKLSRCQFLLNKRSSVNSVNIPIHLANSHFQSASRGKQWTQEYRVGGLDVDGWLCKIVEAGDGNSPGGSKSKGTHTANSTHGGSRSKLLLSALLLLHKLLLTSTLTCLNAYSQATYCTTSPDQFESG